MDIFGKKRIAELEQQLEDLAGKTGWVNDRTKEYQGLPQEKISDTKFVNDLSAQFGMTFTMSKKILDYIEKKIPQEIKLGKKALVWQGLGTFYSVKRRGAWQPRVRFHKRFKGILNK